MLYPTVELFDSYLQSELLTSASHCVISNRAFDWFLMLGNAGNLLKNLFYASLQNRSLCPCVHMIDISGSCSHKIAQNVMHHSSNRQKMIVVMMLAKVIHVVGRPGSALFSPLRRFQQSCIVGSSSNHVLNSWVWTSQSATPVGITAQHNPVLIEAVHGFPHRPVMSSRIEKSIQ